MAQKVELRILITALASKISEDDNGNWFSGTTKIIKELQ
jgi:hypothetical protein